MKKLLYSFFILIIAVLTNAQQIKLITPKPFGGYDALLSKIVYDEELIRKHVEGSVVVSITINEKGEVESSQIVKPLNPKLDKSVLEAVRSTVFLPGVKDGKKAAMQIYLPLLFKDGSVTRDMSAIKIPQPSN